MSFSIRKAFKMSVHPNAHAEYERRHKPIWKELEEVLLAYGARSYSIFLDRETSELFAYAEIENEERWQAIAQTEVCQRWSHARPDARESGQQSEVRSIARSFSH